MKRWRRRPPPSTSASLARGKRGERIGGYRCHLLVRLAVGALPSPSCGVNADEVGGRSVFSDPEQTGKEMEGLIPIVT
uniref:Uncharacterized protein n=1 Tax=Oryza punctata TaxID=4537 RepID=A0A0E0KP69_ORYPU